jgi:hypothetical protein
LFALSVSRLYGIKGKMINECGAVGGMRIGWDSEILEETLPQCHFAHMT